MGSNFSAFKEDLSICFVIFFYGKGLQLKGRARLYSPARRVSFYDKGFRICMISKWDSTKVKHNHLHEGSSLSCSKLEQFPSHS